jgi:hypothetical protein
MLLDPTPTILIRLVDFLLIDHACLLFATDRFEPRAKLTVMNEEETRVRRGIHLHELLKLKREPELLFLRVLRDLGTNDLRRLRSGRASART